MKTEEGTFIGKKGVEIFRRAWVPDTTRAVVILCHGLGEHSGRYAQLAADFDKKDLAVFALDHRGHGKSGGKRGHVDSFDDYLSDLDSFRTEVDERFGDIPRFLLGHSMGGLIAARYAEKNGAGLAGLILSSAALRVDVDASPLKLAAGRFFSKVMPGLSMSNGLDPDKLSHDAEVAEAYKEDPLVHDRVSARWYTEFTAAIEEVHEQAREINVPCLVMQSEKDELVAPRGAPEFFERLTVSDKTLREWEGFYHEMFNEKERQKPVETTLAWIGERLG